MSRCPPGGKISTTFAVSVLRNDRKHIYFLHISKDIQHLKVKSSHCKSFNSLTTGKFEWYFRYLIFQMISVIDGWGISCELALRWMSLDLTDEKSTLVQVMAWCHQATSHYLSQWWPRSLSPYGVARPQWVKRFDFIHGNPIFKWFAVTLTRMREYQDDNHDVLLEGGCRVILTHVVASFFFFFFQLFRRQMDHIPPHGRGNCRQGHRSVRFKGQERMCH